MPWCAEQLEAERQERGTLSVGEKAEVTDAHEALGEQVQEKAVQELVHAQSHEFLLVTVSRITPAKRKLTIREGNQPMIGDGHAVRVATEVVQDVLGTTERGLGVDHPVFAKEQSQPGSESFGLRKRSEFSCEMESAAVERLPKAGDELATKNSGEHFQREKEASGGVPRRRDQGSSRRRE